MELDRAYTVDCSLPDVRHSSFTVWTNFDGLWHMIIKWHELCWFQFRGERDGEHYCMVVTLYRRGDYETVVRMLKDCVTAENLLQDVRIDGATP